MHTFRKTILKVLSLLVLQDVKEFQKECLHLASTDEDHFNYIFILKKNMFQVMFNAVRLPNAPFLVEVFYTDRSGQVSGNLLLDQLPSYQSLLYRRKSTNGSTKRRHSSRGRLGSSVSGKWMNTINRQEDKQKLELKPIRELAKPMAEKRRDKYILLWNPCWTWGVN